MATLPSADDRPSLASRVRARGMTVAGISVILLGVGAALLPVEKSISSDLIGGLLLAAGLIETIAGSLRRETRTLAMGAGIVTAIAGLLFLVNDQSRFFPTVNIVIAWLFLRALILALASRLAGGGVRRWTIISAATDLLLGLVLMIGLSIATLVVTLFGPTPTIIASFSWIIALSFVATGLLLLEIASCVREGAGETAA